MTISNQASDSFVAEVDAQNFQATVIEKSQQVPVVLEFGFNNLVVKLVF